MNMFNVPNWNTDRIISDSTYDGNRVIQYQPGNGTNYVVIVTAIAPEHINIVGAPLFISTIWPGAGSFLSSGGYFTGDYVNEKIPSLTGSDAEVVAQILNHVKESGYVRS